MRRSAPLSLLLATTLLAACDALGSDAAFIPGEIVAAVRYVEPAFVEAYAREHRITVETVAFPEVYLIQTVVHAGALEDYLDALSADPLVDTVRVWRGDGVEIVIRRAAEESYVRALVEAQGGLDVVNVSRGQDLVVFGVPEGDEGRWVSRLEREVFVIHAERNQQVSLR